MGDITFCEYRPYFICLYIHFIKLHIHICSLNLRNYLYLFHQITIFTKLIFRQINHHFAKSRSF